MKNVSISIENPRLSLQSNLPSTAPRPVYQYEYTDMYGSQVFYYSFSSNTPAAWTANGVVFYAFENPRTGTVPVYQYYAVDAGGRYRFMYSTNLYCAVGTSCGWYNSGPAFYAFPNARSYTRPVFTYVVDSPQQRFFYTAKQIVPVGGNWLGWTNAGIGFHVPQIGSQLRTSSLELEGYSSTTSVAPGDTIQFYLNDPMAQGIPYNFKAIFYRVEATGNQSKGFIDGVQIDSQNVDGCKTATVSVNGIDGCSWTTTVSKTIPADGSWPPGLYFLDLNRPILYDEKESPNHIYFVVRPSTLASTSNVLVILPFSTWQAYNTWGGTSTYEEINVANPETNIAFSGYAPFNRPTASNIGRHTAFISSVLNKKDSNGNNYTLEYASDVDLHSNPNLLNSYQLVIMMGQNEYISKPMRVNLDNYVMNGGNLAVFGGNTSWYQIRLENDLNGNPYRKLVCFKERDGDLTTDPSLKTIKWNLLGYPENQTFGLSYLYGTIYGPEKNYSDNLPPEDPHKGWRPGTPLQFEVKQSNHWVYDSTGMQDFQSFGLFYNADGTVKDGLTGTSSAEGDSLHFRCVNDACPYAYPGATVGKKFYPTGDDGAPINFQILAYLDAIPNQLKNYQHSDNNAMAGKHFGAMIGLFENNGTVFNGGLYDWHLGLVHEKNENISNVVSKIVWNVINKLSQPKTLLQKATIAIYQYSDLALNVQSLYYSRLPFLPKNLVRYGQVVYKYDGHAFYAFDRALSGTVPIYQYQVQDPNGLYRFMYSPNQYCPVGTGCLGWNNIGIAFYAYLSQQPGTIPVYAYSADSPQRFLYSPALYCEAGTSCLGWYNNGPAFYVPSSK
ncbi:N,N-dimethylformamidase beta subunit family domain-containing protein [Leptospira barantonii]|nr:N,N-dimethylformamidase beta subunit family domain-containing protein [Leptospira barantonii]